MGKILYRPDIDGLRAVAVGAVVLAHANISPRFNGGFIGVDVFFVISGYLISAILFREIADGDFSIVNFYRRRVLRILPALLVMVAVCTWASIVFLFPVELVDFAKSAIAATLSASNILFWTQAGYFGAPASAKPLLHTWSLGVEEQFYILFPLLLYLVRRFLRRHLAACLAAAGLASFLLSAAGVLFDPDSAYYLLYSRAWELLLGAGIALDAAQIRLDTGARNAMTLAGLAMIVAPVFVYDAQTPFPGLAALVPCLGAAFIILAGKSGKTVVSRLLSLKPFVFIGLISYSLYLWHWPIMVFDRLATPFPPIDNPRLANVALIFYALVAATLSWWFVERPFRGGRLRAVPTPWILAAAGGAAVLAVAANAAILSSNGFADRFPAKAAKVAAYLGYRDAERIYPCFLNAQDTIADRRFGDCLAPSPTMPNDLLIGDSHSEHLYYGLAKQFGHVRILRIGASNCPPVMRQRPRTPAYCRQLMDYIFGKYLATTHVDNVLLAARWQDDDLPALRETLGWAKSRGIAVVLVGPIPQYSNALPRLLAMSIRDRDDALPQRGLLRSVFVLDAAMRKMAEAMKIKYVSLVDMLCQKSSCRQYALGDVPLQYDYGHLTREGSNYVAERIRKSGVLGDRR